MYKFKSRSAIFFSLAFDPNQISSVFAGFCWSHRDLHHSWVASMQHWSFIMVPGMPGIVVCSIIWVSSAVSVEWDERSSRLVVRQYSLCSSSGVPRGQRGLIRPGRHFERGGKKEKKEKKKKEKKSKEREERKRKKERKRSNMEEACNYSKTKMEHLSCGALCTHKLASWRPCPFWRGRVVRIYVLLHKALQCIGLIGTVYILAPLLGKSTHTNLSNRKLPFWRPFTFWRPYAGKARFT